MKCRYVSCRPNHPTILPIPVEYILGIFRIIPASQRSKTPNLPPTGQSAPSHTQHTAQPQPPTRTRPPLHNTSRPSSPVCPPKREIHQFPPATSRIYPRVTASLAPQSHNNPEHHTVVNKYNTRGSRTGHSQRRRRRVHELSVFDGRYGRDGGQPGRLRRLIPRQKLGEGNEGGRGFWVKQAVMLRLGL